MKINNKKLESLSSLLDDELNPTEKELLTDELKSDVSLQKELQSIKEIKDLVNGIKPLPEDHYFETRLFERIKSEKLKVWYSFLFRKPIIIFASVTLILMAIFRFYPGIFVGFIDEQKANLMDLYAANLKPFIFNVGLNSDDIFDFAFNRSITLDKENNQVLLFGVDEAGKDFFEVKFEDGKKNENKVNLASFVESLELDSKQKKQFDSILLSYSDDLASQILVNENKTVAVNPNIVNYQNALKADVMAFAAQANKTAFAKIFPVNVGVHNVEDIAKLVSNVKKSDNNNYFVFTPDTIFTSSFDVDKALLKSEISRFKDQIVVNKDMKGFDDEVRVFVRSSNSNSQRSNKELKIVVNDDFCKVEIPDFAIPDIQLPNLVGMNEAIEIAFGQMRDMKVNIKIDTVGKKQSFSMKYNDKKGNKSGFDIQLDSRGLGLQSLDSLQNVFKFFMQDTVMVNSKELRKEMERVKKEMQFFREEMEKMRKELNPESTPTKKEKTPIEI
jgi:hypothetical protein